MKFLLVIVCVLVLTFIVYPPLIRFLHQLKFGQAIREEGPKSHQIKKGTPTMGGLGFIFITIISVVIVNPELLMNIQFLLLSGTLLSYGCIGFVDDYLIVVQKRNDGLRPRYKLIAQFVFAIVFYLIYRHYGSTIVQFPFLSVDLGHFYLLLLIVMFMGESNAVNLTDGIDGLCATVYCVALIPFGFIAYMRSEFVVLMFITALFSALIGYLFFNWHPAKVFMGDTGSLALGGCLAAIAVILKVELLLIIIGLVFLIETLSVMIQVAYYKKTRKRIFLMSPIHHHFELKGWNEIQIVCRFAMFGIICGVIGVLIWLMF